MNPNPSRFSLRFPRPLQLFLAAVVVSLVCFWYVAVRPMQNHSRAYARISNAVESLASRRPADVSRNQWSYIIGWTRNGIGNCCSVDGFLKPDEESHERFRNLPDRFEERLRREVSLETVDWFWDELESISKYGKSYSAQWRPTTTERLQEAEATPVGDSGPIVD